MSDISLEPLANRGNADGQGVLVTPIAEVGAVSNRTAITVTDVAQEITIGSGKTSIELENSGTNIVYYGGSAVDSTSGLRILQNNKKIFNKVKGDFSIYLICAAGLTSTIRIGEYL